MSHLRACCCGFCGVRVMLDLPNGTPGSFCTAPVFPHRKWSRLTVTASFAYEEQVSSQNPWSWDISYAGSVTAVFRAAPNPILPSGNPVAVLESWVGSATIQFDYDFGAGGTGSGTVSVIKSSPVGGATGGNFSDPMNQLQVMECGPLVMFDIATDSPFPPGSNDDSAFTLALTEVPITGGSGLCPSEPGVSVSWPTTYQRQYGGAFGCDPPDAVCSGLHIQNSVYQWCSGIIEA